MRAQQTTWEALLPGRIECGPVARLAPIADRVAAGRLLVVSDQGVARAGVLERALGALGDRVAAVVADVPQDSSFATVERVAAAARAAGADGVVSVGGGSVIDTAKAVAVVLSGVVDLRERPTILALAARPAPHIAVPTTAGTGSEATRAFVLLDPERREKRLFVDDAVLPSAALLDASLTLALPPAATAAAGLDALAHAVEALHSRRAGPLTDALALHAARLIAGALPAVLAAPDDLDARRSLLVAATLAGIAVSNANAGLAHALAHPLGARHRLAHGAAVGVLLPHVMRFNAEEAGVRAAYAALAQALGGGDAIAAAAGLLERSGLPLRLREAGVAGGELAALAEAALADPTLPFNGRRVRRAGEALSVLQAAW